MTTDTTSPARTFQGEHDTYEILSQLGAGGFGITHKARRASDGLPVVVKALRVERMDDWKALELFEREMNTLEALDHPGIPNYIDHFEMDSGLAFVQEFVDGQSLAELRRNSRKTLQEHLRWFDQVLEILEYLHGLSPPVVHRDITPGNVLLGTQRPYLIDFGNVQAAVFKESQSTVAGTLGFAPMEQFVGRAGPRSDLYSLAMTFLSVVSGRDPSQMPIEGVQVQVRELLADQSPDPRLTILLNEMTRPDLNQRIANATEVRRRLAPLLGGQATELVLPEPTDAATVTDGPPDPFDAPAWAAAFLQVPDGELPEALTYPLFNTVFSDDGTWIYSREACSAVHTTGQETRSVSEFRWPYVTNDGQSGTFPESPPGAVDPNGELLAVCDGYEVNIYDRRSGTRRETLSFKQSPEQVTFSPDGRILFVHPRTAIVDGQRRRVPMVRAFYSPDGRFLLGTGRLRRSAVHLYENRDGLPGKTLGRIQLPGVPEWARFSVDSRWVVIGTRLRGLVVATTDPFQIRWFLNPSSSKNGAISAGNRWLLLDSWRDDGEESLIHVYCLHTGYYAGALGRANRWALTFVDPAGQSMSVREGLNPDRQVDPTVGGMAAAVQRFVASHVSPVGAEHVKEAMALGRHLPLVLVHRAQKRPRFQSDDQTTEKIDLETFRHDTNELLARHPEEREALLHQLAEGAPAPAPGWWRRDLTHVDSWKSAPSPIRRRHPDTEILNLLTRKYLGPFQRLTWIIIAAPLLLLIILFFTVSLPLPAFVVLTILFLLFLPVIILGLETQRPE